MKAALNRRLMFLTAVAVTALLPFAARCETPDEFFSRLKSEYNAFGAKQKQEYDAFRARQNAEYAEFMAHPWKAVRAEKPIERPDRPDPGPSFMPDDEKPLKWNGETVELTTPRIARDADPQPVNPFSISPKPGLSGAETVSMSFYGTPVELREIVSPQLKMKSADKNEVAAGWRRLSEASTDNLIAECLRVRDELALSDWYYMRLADEVSRRIFPSESPEQVLLMGYLLNQSGFDVRFAECTADGRLHLLFNTSGTIYLVPRFSLDGGMYYPWKEPAGSIRVCDFKTPGERRVSLAMPHQPRLAFAEGAKREVKVHEHPELTLNVVTNRNLIDMLDDFPNSAIGESEHTRWLAQAEMPVSPQIEADVYPALREAVAGLSQYDAVNLLLKVAQSFPYEYDSKLWGRDRIFFMDESWHYPYSDCEDHAINFTRMVRDILGLDCCLVVYPGHLSAGAAITDGTAKGDCIVSGGKRYTLCDGTFFYAPAGMTAPGYDNSKAIPVPVRK